MFQLYKEHDFMRLKFPILSYILRSDNLNVPSEEDVFKALKLWVDQSEERQKHTLDLLNCLRLNCLSLEVSNVLNKKIAQVHARSPLKNAYRNI